MTARQHLERIYDTYAELLFQYFRARTRSDDDSHELLQDIFVNLGKHRAKSGPTDQIHNEKAWLFAIARNLVIDRVRRRDTRHRITQDYVDELTTANLFAHSPDPDVAQLRSDLSTALHDLPEPQRVVVYLKLIASMTFSEIAIAETISSSTAVSRYRYGIEKLQRTLKPVYKEITEP